VPNYLIFETNDWQWLRKKPVKSSYPMATKQLPFGEQVIREMKQVASHWRVYQKAVFTVVPPALPHSEKLSRHRMPFQDHVTQGGRP
jgi:hypothetical protein